MKKAKVALSMSVLMTASAVLAACGGSSSGTSPQGEAGKPSAPVKLEYFYRGSGQPQADKDFYKKELDAKLGIDLVANGVADVTDYQNKLNVRLSSGDYPDIFFAETRLHLKALVDMGVALDLTKYVENQLKPVNDFMMQSSDNKDIWSLSIYGGKVMAVPKSPSQNKLSQTFWIRKDWLTKLNLPVPTTLDELFATAKAFTTQDPDGNGKQDTYGLIGEGLSAFNGIFGAFGVTAPVISNAPSAFLRDGKLVYSTTDPAMKDALTYIKKLVDAGVVDPDLVTLKQQQANERIWQGKAGIAYTGWNIAFKEDSVQKMKQIDPKAEWIQIQPIKGPGGAYDQATELGKGTGFTVLSKSLEKNPEKLNKALELLNYLSTKEGSRLVMYGLPDVHYKLQGDKIVPTELMIKEANFAFYQMIGNHQQEYLNVKFPYNVKDIEFTAKAPRLQTLNGYYIPSAGVNLADMSRYITEETTKFIYGTTPLDKYGDYVSSLDTKFGMKAYRDDMDKQLKEKGILK